MCSGRVDLEFIFKAFLSGQDGVLIGGCRLNECNYITHGNYDALGNSLIAKKILARLGIDPDRLRIEFMNASDGQRFARVVDEFTAQVRELGPLGEPEELSPESLRFKLEAARKIVPYIRLVERERLRVPVKSEEEYRRFFESEDVERLFDELIGDKLAVSQIVQLLGEGALSTADIAERLAIGPSQVSRHMSEASVHGLVRYDLDRKRYARA